MLSSTDGMRVTTQDLHRFCVDAMKNVGVSTEHADTTADALVMTDTWGVFTHGTKLLHGYEQRLRLGGLRTDVEPRIERESAASAVVDGGSVLGQVTSTFAMNKAVELAKTSGIGLVGVRNSCHFGAAGYYSQLAASQGMIGMAMANDVPIVAAPGSRGAVLGTNPMSYAVPAGKYDPILLDIATSAVAAGKVFAAVQSGRPIPDNWIIGPDGKPSTEGHLLPEKASMQPMAGHKGYGIALLIESLAGLLTGASYTWDVGSWLFGDLSKPTDHGGAFLAVNVESFMPRDMFYSRVDALIDQIHASPTADGVERIYVPGEMEWTRRKKSLVEGIMLPVDVMLKLRELAETVGIEPL